MPAHLWQPRHAALIGALCAAALVAACGGGGGGGDADGSIASTTTSSDGRAYALADPSRVDATVVSLVKVSETRISRTVFDYLFRISIRNNVAAQVGVTAELVATGPGTTIVDGSVFVGDLAAGATASPPDTITLRHDRGVAFNSAALVWRIRGAPLVPAIVPGASLYNLPAGQAVVGTLYEAGLRIAPVDPRNVITSLQVTNATTGGAAPTISLAGLLSWTPNAADFATRSLRITALHQDGSTSPFDVPVAVTRYRLVAQVPLNGAGRYSDPDGRYLIDVAGATAAGGVTGTLTIAEQFDTSGAYTSVISSTDETHVIRVINDPPGTGEPRTSASTLGAGRAPAAAAGTARRLATSPSLANNVQYITGQRIDTQTNVYTTREDVRLLVRGLQFDPLLGRPVTAVTYRRYPRVDVARVEANCNRTGSCNEPRFSGKTPVILIHGFIPEACTANALGPTIPFVCDTLGGGDGTWGYLAEELTRRGHPVFELRWQTQMRFEEAAGLLTNLGYGVAQATGRKPFIIAHSFGGIAAHLALAGEGISWNANAGRWDKQPAGTPSAPLFDGLVTLGSPLSGINQNGSNPDFVKGRYFDDGTISICESVTCVQAAAFDVVPLDALQRNVALIDGTSGVRPAVGTSSMLATGESTTRLQQAWAAGSINLPAADLHAVVSLRERPYDDWSPNLNRDDGRLLGDGLISLVGQAVVPRDFLCTNAPFPAPDAYDVPFCVQPAFADFFRTLDEPPVSGAVDTLTHATLNGRRYHFATRAAHTSSKTGVVSYVLNGGIVRYETNPYSIANYPAPVTTAFGVVLRGSGLVVVDETDVLGLDIYAYHPLRYFLDNVLRQADATPAVLGPVVSTVSGSVVLGTTGLSTNVAPAWISIVPHDGDVPVRQRRNLPLDSQGNFSLDVAAQLRAELPSSAVLSDYRIRVEVGDGIDFIRMTVYSERLRDVSAVYDLGRVLLIPRSAIGPLVTAAGTVTVSGSGNAVAGAEIWLLAGVNRSASEVRSWPSSTVARRVVADANGAFSAVDLRAGEYTVLASRSGYADNLQGRVVIDGSQVLSIQLQASSGTLLVENFDRSNGTAIGNGWLEESYRTNAAGVNLVDAVSILENRLRISHTLNGNNVDAGVYRPFPQSCGVVVSGSVEWVGNLATSAVVTLNGVQTLNQQGLQLILSPPTNGLRNISFFHEGAETRPTVPFTFVVDTLYRFEWTVQQDCSTDVRVWRADQARPAVPTASSPAVTPVQRTNPLLALFASGGAGCCAYPGYDLRIDDILISGVDTGSSVVLSRTGVDENIQYGAVTDYYGYYFMGYDALANPPVPRYWVSTREFDTVRVKKTGGTATCTQIAEDAGLLDETGYAIARFSSATTNGEYCVFTQRVPAGTRIGSFFVSPRPVGIPFALAGSASNGGRSANGFNTADRAGGFAFQFCSGPCDQPF